MDLWSQTVQYQNLENQIQHGQLEQFSKHSKSMDQDKQVIRYHLLFI